MSDTPSPPDTQSPRSPPSPPSFVNRHWSDTVLSVLAILIAAISLWVANETEKTNRQLVAEAAWPFLQIYHSSHGSEGQPMLSLNIANAGIGPAKIETFEVFWDGKPYRTSEELLKACCGYAAAQGGDPSASSSSTHALGTSEAAGLVLRPGDTDQIIRYLRTPANTAIYDAFDAARNEITYRICYCSAFDECWLSNGHDLHPPRVETCPQPAVAYTE